MSCFQAVWRQENSRTLKNSVSVNVLRRLTTGNTIATEKYLELIYYSCAQFTKKYEGVMFDYIRADMRRHLCCDGQGRDTLTGKLFILFFAYGFHASTVYRYGVFINGYLGHGVRRLFYHPANILYYFAKWMTEKMYGIYIDRKASIGPGLYIGHFGGIRIGRCHIGKTCNIHQQVKIADGCVLGNRVWVGAHAVLEGGARIADGATIVVGAVVASSVCPRCLASGNPARIINRQYKNNHLLGLQ